MLIKIIVLILITIILILIAKYSAKNEADLTIEHETSYPKINKQDLEIELLRQENKELAITVENFERSCDIQKEDCEQCSDDTRDTEKIFQAEIKELTENLNKCINLQTFKRVLLHYVCKGSRVRILSNTIEIDSDVRGDRYGHEYEYERKDYSCHVLHYWCSRGGV